MGRPVRDKPGPCPTPLLTCHENGSRLESRAHHTVVFRRWRSGSRRAPALTQLPGTHGPTAVLSLPPERCVVAAGPSRRRTSPCAPRRPPAPDTCACGPTCAARSGRKTPTFQAPGREQAMGPPRAPNINHIEAKPSRSRSYKGRREGRTPSPWRAIVRSIRKPRGKLFILALRAFPRPDPSSGRRTLHP